MKTVNQLVLEVAINGLEEHIANLEKYLKAKDDWEAVMILAKIEGVKEFMKGHLDD